VSDIKSDKAAMRGLAPLIAAIIAIFITAFFMAAVPNFPNLEPYKIAAAEIKVLPHEGVGPFRRKRVNEKEYDLLSASEIPLRTRRQYVYTFRLNEPPKTDGSVFSPFVGGTAVIYMNGVRIASTQSMTASIPGFSQRYISGNIPISSYQAGINRLTIVLTPDSSYAGISSIYYGESGTFNQAPSVHNRNLRLLVFWKIGLGVLTFIIALLALLGPGRSCIKIYLPLLIIGASVSALGLFSGSFNGVTVNEQKWVFVLIYSALLLGNLILARTHAIFKNPINLGLWAAAIISSSIAVITLMPFARPSAMHSLSYLSVSGAVPFALFLASTRFWEDRQEAILSKAKLEQKILEQKDIISAQEAAMHEALKAKGKLEERQRLTRDIHDGIGGQLLSLLVRVRDGGISKTEIEKDLQYGLNDLRLIVDSMAHSDRSLDSAFLTFRARAKAQLKAANIQLDWAYSDPFVSVSFDSAAILNIYRFMQEVVTNAIRHSECSRISINIAREKPIDDLIITLWDNGIGFDHNDTAQSGHGIKNLRFRAKVIGADLSIERGDIQGMTTRLTVPTQT